MDRACHTEPANMDPTIEQLGDLKAFEPRVRLARSTVTRWLLLLSGSVLVGIGVLGIFLPLLPSTVFFLGAAWCYARSSERMYRWLMENRLFGRHLRQYTEERGATAGAKFLSIATLWSGIGLSAYLIEPPVLVDIALGLIAVLVTWHLLKLRTIRRG
jgi:hypothetical protein